MKKVILDTDISPDYDDVGAMAVLHTLAKRGHCFHHQTLPGTGSYTYLDRIWEFLSSKGFNK